jgi:hypothetical protein
MISDFAEPSNCLLGAFRYVFMTCFHYTCASAYCLHLPSTASTERQYACFTEDRHPSPLFMVWPKTDTLKHKYIPIYDVVRMNLSQLDA